MGSSIPIQFCFHHFFPSFLLCLLTLKIHEYANKLRAIRWKISRLYLIYRASRKDFLFLILFNPHEICLYDILLAGLRKWMNSSGCRPFEPPRQSHVELRTPVDRKQDWWLIVSMYTASSLYNCTKIAAHKCNHSARLIPRLNNFFLFSSSMYITYQCHFISIQLCCSDEILLDTRWLPCFVSLNKI